MISLSIARIHLMDKKQVLGSLGWGQGVRRSRRVQLMDKKQVRPDPCD